MPTPNHSIDARANVSLIAAFLLIVGLGVISLVSFVQEPSSDAIPTEAFAQFVD